VQVFEKGKAYLLDFWATWCGPCVASIPHIEHLHQKYKDQGLVVIGQNVWEDDTSKISAFVEKVANKMTYRIALDSQEAVAKPWLRAAGQNGIPVVILVGKDGNIAWIDHPEALSETVVEQVLAGTFDLAKEKRLQQVRGKISGAYYEAFRKFQPAIKTRNWVDAQALLDRMKSIVPADDTEWRAVIRKQQFTLLVAKREDNEAIKLGESILTDEKQNSGSANSLVWVIAHAENPSVALLKFAEMCAMQANEATRGQHPRILENLARLHFRQGNRSEAIQRQEQAIDRATSPDEEKRLRDGLAAYQKGQLPTQ
jgi:thiol-disulfide isomerase/thioredoxin